MSEFRATENATVSPTRCFFCHEYVGPFIDTHVEDLANGHIWICAPTENRSGCLGQMAHAFGMLTAIEAEALMLENTSLKEQVRALEEARTVQISYDDLLKVMETSPRKLAATKGG